ncbi:MAG: hypothetical protein ABSE39_05995 [Candidatus Bathyarchaeia archaeon]|jgi:uncharacterized membrane protein
MSTQQPVNQDAKHSTSLRIVEVVLVLVGLVLAALSVILPILMGAITERGGAGAAFRSGYLRALTPFITNVSMASCFLVAVVILSFEKSGVNAKSVMFGILTLSAFTAEITLSLYLSLVRLLPAAAPTLMAIYVLIGLVPLGLGCTMFTLASIFSAR